MKGLFFSFALAMALAIPSLASAENTYMSNCKKGEGKCTTEFYDVTGKSYVMLNCTDGSNVSKELVSSPNTQVSCYLTQENGASHFEFVCDDKNHNITYDIKSHLTCE